MSRLSCADASGAIMIIAAACDVPSFALDLVFLLSVSLSLSLAAAVRAGGLGNKMI